MNTERPDLSIVLVSWNAREHLDRCVSSILRHTREVKLELVVVDNASSDGTVAALRRDYPDLKIRENSRNVGFARAGNQGMSAATGKLLLLLNPDTYVEDDVIGRAVRLMTSRPEIGMLGCQLRYPDGRLQHNANRALTIRRSLLERLWLYRFIPRRRRGRLLLGGYWDHDEEAEVDWLAGAFMLLRRELFAGSGGFDERFFMYGEDSEWCMRLRRMGHRILFTPAPGTVFHTGSVSSDLVWGEDERLRRCYLGGINSYAALNGRGLAACYRVAELLGSVVRFWAYAMAGLLRADDYYSRQATFYRWLIEFYVAPSDDMERPEDSFTTRAGRGGDTYREGARGYSGLMLTKVRHAVGERIGRPRRWRILESVPTDAVGAEIGVYKGDFTREVLAHIRPAELHLIDAWWTLEGDMYAHPWYAQEGEADTRAAYRAVEALAREHQECVIHVGDDLEILTTFPDNYFDWVYLDTSHRYEHTVKELAILRYKVRPDGMISGHDWYPDPSHEHHGVYRAVKEFCDDHGWDLEAPDLWDQWLIRPNSAWSSKPSLSE